MQIAHFLIPIAEGSSRLEECNSFLSSVRVVALDRQFTTCAIGPCWSILVQYLDGPGGGQNKKKPKVDYKEILSPEDFAVFSEMRKIRKELAERDGVPVYAVFTNEQLAEIVTQKITTATGLSGVAGVGESKVKKFGAILSGFNVEN